MNITGIVYKCPDNVDTDIIIPAKYLNNSDPNFLAIHCLEPLVEQTGKKLNSEHIIVAGKNFGCGSSREHAALSIKYAGIKCVVAESFARIFFRNAINIGLPVIELPSAKDKFQQDDKIEINFIEGSIKNLSTGEKYKIASFPDFLLEIINSGGLVSFVRKSLLK
ncbi:MAG: 3-isopropylmalate dehydratase small subunit [Endomicrobia bacterium]|nr:3-isopropylmalate dehydratase small subunit [Endomicrobiia bacterium]